MALHPKMRPGAGARGAEKACADGSAMYVSSMKYMTYPLALPRDYCVELREAAGKTGLSMADIIRQSSRLGLPLLLEQFGPARITNVPPLPPRLAQIGRA